MLKILRAHSLNKVLVLVVRHWMGTYLGLAKLSRAYQSCTDALCSWHGSKQVGDDNKVLLYRYDSNGKDIVFLSSSKLRAML